jgi:hypothetical protein
LFVMRRIIKPVKCSYALVYYLRLQMVAAY